MQTGKIKVTTENIFPIIKKFLYSDHEIFLRELISNAVDASQKLKVLSLVGKYEQELPKQVVRVKLDKDAKTLTISDQGLGMTAEELDKYINQIAFSSAEEFLEKYKDKTEAIIGHFGLGFYSSFMVAERVDIITKSYQKDAKAVKWSCDGSPEFTVEDAEKEAVGTDIVLHIDEDSKEFLEEGRIRELLTKYNKFMPVEIAFGKEKKWEGDQEIETDKDLVINNTAPAWTKKPSELSDEDYQNFYQELYPASEAPLFHIHLNIDFPFHLTGILYFPKIKNTIEIQKNKIQLFSNQVFITDSTEGVVPDFLSLLHGVIDSPDIPLNVSRSYLQSDANVKKIAGYITKKVADRLNEIFKKDRTKFEEKWDDLKLFVEYGMLTDEKFYDKASKFMLFKNTDGKYFTFEEYKKLIEANQTDKDKKLVYIYASNAEAQYSFIEGAKSKGYDVLLMDGHFDNHFVNHIEQKLTDSRFVRVDSEVADKLIAKDEHKDSKLSIKQQNDLIPVFKSNLKPEFSVVFETMAETDSPMTITQSEFMRRMKDMAEMGGGGMGFYGNLPDSYNLVVNSNHPLVLNINELKDKELGENVASIEAEMKPLEDEKQAMEAAQKDKKDEEIPQADKDKLEDVNKEITELTKKKESLLEAYGKENKIVKQLIDLALLSNNMLKGEALNRFVKRSVELVK